MPRYINAVDAINAILKERDAVEIAVAERYSFGVKLPNPTGMAIRCGIRKSLRCIEQTPTADVVEVVRCEDCKYCDIGENEVDAWCDCRLLKIGCDPLFYCERGERRNDD